MSILRDNVNSGPEGLRKVMKKSCVMAPGVFDGISGILAERAGFEALYLSGSGIAGKYGLPDLSVTTLTEVTEEARRVVSVTKLPLIVDVDTGFGEALNVTRTVRLMESAGAAALHIEDQQLPKKCGHLSGKMLVTEDEMVQKIRAAVSARKNDDFMVIARTDSRTVEGFEGAVKRAEAYIDAGADAIFPEALESENEFKMFAKRVDTTLLANMTEFGKSPLISADKLGSMGYKIVIFPLTAFRSSLLAMNETYMMLKKNKTQGKFVDRLMSRAEFYEAIGYSSYEKEDKTYTAERTE